MKECLNCGSTENLQELQSGKFVCNECLKELAQEQEEIKKDFLYLLENKYSIKKTQNQIKIFKSIALEMELEILIGKIKIENLTNKEDLN